jgi:hypothetical protein
MPINHAIWKVGSKPTPLQTSKLLSEQQLEDMIVTAPEILSGEWLLIGRQEQTGLGGRIDLLAIAPDGSLVLIELKRNRTPREVVAQAIDYASWVENLTADKISQIYLRFSGGGELDVAFRERFGVELDEDNLNASHQIILVAAELDDSTERIIKYLNAREIAINLVFFQVFQYGNDKLLSRAWMIDPGETQANVTVTTRVKGEKEPWNGEFYVSFGGDCTWEDARTYGFISAGGGTWYVQTLKLLNPGDRIWIKIPGSGYAGVGIVSESVQSVQDFTVNVKGKDQLALDVLNTKDKLRELADDPEKCEHFVRIKWLDTVPQEKALRSVGFFGNQNTVCQPSSPKWRHTIERLKTHFPKWNSSPK